MNKNMTFFLKEINILWLNSPEFLQRFKIDTFLTVISSQKEVVGYISAEIMLSSHLLYIYIYKKIKFEFVALSFKNHTINSHGKKLVPS